MTHEDLVKGLEAPANPNIPDLHPGDSVKVHVRIIEGDRERIQIFPGTIIRMRKGGNDARSSSGTRFFPSESATSGLLLELLERLERRDHREAFLDPSLKERDRRVLARPEPRRNPAVLAQAVPRRRRKRPRQGRRVGLLELHADAPALGVGPD